jgi:hypothetical protein
MLVKLDLMRLDSFEPVQETFERLSERHIHDICILKSNKEIDRKAVYRATTQIAKHLDEGMLEFLMPEDDVKALKEFLGIQSMIETLYLTTELGLGYGVSYVDRALFDLFYNLATELGEC